MKKLFIVIVLLSLFAIPCLGGEEYLADQGVEPQDFRGIKWGQSAKSVPGLKELYREEDGSLIIYSRTGDDMLFGAAVLASVEYIFVDDKLSRIAVVAKGKPAEDELLKQAFSFYGKESINVGEDYMWRFASVSIMFSREPDLGQSVLYYMYKSKK
ncbi:MAG: hypothetical protein LBQ58_11240 [Synergistaceae bacterium]|nr:hypothetical protein [Synergistaceae bacterium]